ncbi:MAG: NADH-quinone oxidoreductase subunit D [Dehalococcoidia bacterium]
MPIKSDLVEVNIGPQHPSTHGVFRMVAVIDGERIVDVKMVVGYLHRSMEKLAEERTYTQNIPFTDRMDYLAAMTGNLGYCLSVEKLSGIEVPERGQYLRTIFAELQRVASHEMATGAFINDCGAWQTPVMWCFRDREKVLDLFEMVCGARITTNYMRIGGVAFDIPEEFLPAVDRLVNDDLPARFEELESLIVGNEIIQMRARDVGVVTPAQAINAALSGPMLRSAGIAWDIRKADPYCVYDRLNFEIPVGYNGDSYDRMVIRIEEMKQSLRIIRQCMHDLPGGPHKNEVPLAIRPPVGEAYSRVESPKGELGFYVVSDGSSAPYRWHVRAPSLINLSVLREMTVGQTIADAIVTLGSIDINVGEVDR